MARMSPKTPPGSSGGTVSPVPTLMEYADLRDTDGPMASYNSLALDTALAQIRLSCRRDSAFLLLFGHRHSMLSATQEL